MATMQELLEKFEVLAAEVRTLRAENEALKEIAGKEGWELYWEEDTPNPQKMSVKVKARERKDYCTLYALDGTPSEILIAHREQKLATGKFVTYQNPQYHRRLAALPLCPACDNTKHVPAVAMSAHFKVCHADRLPSFKGFLRKMRALAEVGEDGAEEPEMELVPA